jgi:cobalamin biosynthesis protein CbiM/cobalt ECF transporter T component CbiQ
MEGFLPHPWWEIWFAITIPLVTYGIYRLSKIAKTHNEAKPLLALMGAFIFVVSALKLPSVFGSSSHPTGSGLAAVIFGPAVASVLSLIALVFQATLLAHGGLTTLGANVFSMGIVGPVVAYVTWIVCKKVRVPTPAGVFLAVALSDLFTYVTTSVQLALAFPASGFFVAFAQFATVFAVTQIPLAIAEGILAVFIFDFLSKYKGQILSKLKVIRMPVALDSQKGSMQLKKKHYAILIAVLLTLFLLPIVLLPGADFGGADDAAGQIISDMGYIPWFDSLWTLPEGLESLMFAVQAIIGASIIAYIVGYERGKRRSQTSNAQTVQEQQVAHKASHEISHTNLCAQIDRYAYTNALGKTSPTTKIFFAISMLLISVLSPLPAIPVLIFLAVSVLIVLSAEIPVKFYLNLLKYPLLLVAVSCLFIALFFGNGEALLQVPFPWFTWTIYSNGLTMAYTTFFRVIGAVSALYFLVLTTSMTDIVISLRKIRIPKILIEISLLVYRYIFVFMEVTSKMTTAQKLRLGTASWSKRIRSTSLLAGNLFIRSLEQGERTFVAMNARGYDGNYRVLEDLPRAKASTLALIVVFDIFLVMLALNIINIWSM